jgi:signal transduction histidine kinase/CheY-like chemotaxis protein
MTSQEDIAEAVVVEHTQYINRNMLTGVSGGFIIAAIVTVTFWQQAPHDDLLLWLLAQGLVAMYRISVWYRYSRRQLTIELARRCSRETILGTAVSGMVWGLSTTFLMIPGDLLYQIVLVFTISMMGVSAMFSFGVHMATFLAFFIPSMTFVVASLLWQGERLHYELALGIAVYAIVALRFVTAFNGMFVRSLELRYRNVALVRELTAEKDSAESANLAKSRFLAAASHDLRQPLHALSLYLGTLAGFELPGKARAILGHVRQCADTMDELFRGLLDISRLDAGAVRADVSTFAIDNILERIRVEFEPQARAKQLRLRVARNRALVRSDPEMLERIVRNFTVNAVRHTERGTILIGCRRRGTQLRVAVYDTGTGIAPEQHKSVFEEFFQIGNPNRDRSRGIGLGLAIVDRLARLLDARVSLVSALGRGSMFAVDVPLASGTSASPAPVAQPAPRIESISGMTVVVVDDEEPILDAMRGLLEQWGCTVVAARSGDEAMEQLRSHSRAPDALVCDFRLADGRDGTNVVEQLRVEFNEDIPALIVTGDTAPERLRAIVASGLEVIYKPIAAESLRQALARVVLVT